MANSWVPQGFVVNAPLGWMTPLRVILCIEVRDVLDVNTETGLFHYISVSVATEKNFDGITGDYYHLSGLLLVYIWS